MWRQDLHAVRPKWQPPNWHATLKLYIIFFFKFRSLTLSILYEVLTMKNCWADERNQQMSVLIFLYNPPPSPNPVCSLGLWFHFISFADIQQSFLIMCVDVWPAMQTWHGWSSHSSIHPGYRGYWSLPQGDRVHSEYVASLSQDDHIDTENHSHSVIRLK